MKTKTSILFSKLFGTVAETIRRYPFTCTAIFLFGSVFAICLDQFENGATPFLAAILAAGTGGFLTESIFPRQSKKWALGILVSLGISIAFGFFCPKGEWVFSARLYNRVLAAFCSVTFLLGIWRCIIGSKRTFSEWFYDMSIRMIRAVVLVGVVLIGVLFVGFIFMFLILGSTDFNPILRIELFLFFLLAGIGFLDATRITQENDSQPFFKLLITRIMLPILIIGFVIVYGYIARIAIVHVVPSNEVFRILAVLFLAGMPICVAADSFEKETALLKIGNWLPAAFVPFFGLQGYAIGVRIAQFGITEARYLGVLLMVFEVIFLIFWIFKRKISPILLPVASLLVIVALVIPAFNIFDASFASQRNIFERYSGKSLSSLDIADQRKYLGAYAYLNHIEQGKNYLESVNPEVITMLDQADVIVLDSEQDSLFLYKDFSGQPVVVTDFDLLTSIYFSEEDMRGDLTAVPYTDFEQNFKGTVDLSGIVREMLAANRKGGLTDTNISNIIPLENGGQIWIGSISVTINQDDTESLTYFSGYLLEKKEHSAN